MSQREIKYGQLLAISNLLSKKVKDRGTPTIAEKYVSQIGLKPAQTITRIHRDLLQHTDKFGPDELALLDMFGEIMADLDLSEFTNDPLSGSYLQAYFSQQDFMRNVIGVEEAAQLWGLTSGTIKNYCAQGKIIAKKLGRDWGIDKRQPNPRKAD